MQRYWKRFLLLTAVAFIGSAGPSLAQIEGTYETIAEMPAKHSLDVVLVEEFLNFTCPHCNNFRTVSKPVFAKYGKRVKKENIPILFRGQPDFPLRLYFIAEKAGKGAEVKDMLFDATFKHGVNINDPKVVSFLARSAGLADEFRREVNADWLTRKIREAQLRADAMGVHATPTLVLHRSLRLVPKTGMQAFVNNLDRILAQILKKE